MRLQIFLILVGILMGFVLFFPFTEIIFPILKNVKKEKKPRAINPNQTKIEETTSIFKKLRFLIHNA
jgi:hypothetical protein